MKLKIITKSNTRSSKYCGVHFGKNGTLTIYELAAEKIQVKEGDHVAILQDEDKPDDFYLMISDNKELPKLRIKSSIHRIFVTGYSEGRKAILNRFQLPDISLKLIVGGAITTPEGTAWALITAPLKQLPKEVNGGS